MQSLRFQVTANNIANAEVPGYKRQSVNFESELKRAFTSRDTDHDSFHMVTTDERHFQSEQPRDWKDVEPRRVTEYYTSTDSNGANVDAEQEAMTLVQIQLQYQLLTQLENFQFAQVNTAMKKI